MSATNAIMIVGGVTISTLFFGSIASLPGGEVRERIQCLRDSHPRESVLSKMLSASERMGPGRRLSEQEIAEVHAYHEQLWQKCQDEKNKR